MEHQRIKYLGVVMMIIIGFTSCYYDVEEELYSTIECFSDNMSYQNDILPIIINNCYECHSAQNNFGNITLEGYNRISQYVNSGQLEGAINHESGYSPMPKNKAKLLDCEIEKIVSWINAGAPNN